VDRLLEPNLCRLEPHEWYKDRAQILHRIQRHVSLCLAYACTFWASHLVVALEDGAELDAGVEQLLERFASRHLLTWLEALSIIGRVNTAYPSLDMVRTIVWQSHSAGIPTVTMPEWPGRGDTGGPSKGIVQRRVQIHSAKLGPPALVSNADL
jgi:hypothetical protein